MGFEEANKISESIEKNNTENKTLSDDQYQSTKIDSGEVSENVSESENNSTEGLVDNPTESNTDREVSPVQKRINQLTSQKKEAQEESSYLKQEVERLRQQISNIQEPKQPELTLDVIKSELTKAIDDGDKAYEEALRDEKTKLLIKEEKEKIFKDQETQYSKNNAQIQEWNSLSEQYGKYGLTDKNSDFFKLAKAHYTNDKTLSQTQSVMVAFKEMFEDGLLESNKIKQKDRQIVKERSRMALGGGNSNPSGNIPNKKKTSEDYNSEYIKERIAKQKALQGSSFI